MSGQRPRAPGALTLEAVRSVHGAWRLLLGDRSGMEYFNATRIGFWRSFVAPAVVFPPLMLLQLFAIVGADLTERIDWATYGPIQSIAFVILCAGFPLAMFHVSGFIGRGGRFLGFIAAYNWSSIVQMAILFPLASLAHLDLLPDGGGDLLLWLARVGMLVYTAYIARVALDVGLFMAIGVVVGDLVFSEMVMGVAAQIAFSHAPPAQ